MSKIIKAKLLSIKSRTGIFQMPDGKKIKIIFPSTTLYPSKMLSHPFKFENHYFYLMEKQCFRHKYYTLDPAYGADGLLYSIIPFSDKLTPEQAEIALKMYTLTTSKMGQVDCCTKDFRNLYLFPRNGEKTKPSLHIKSEKDTMDVYINDILLASFHKLMIFLDSTADKYLREPIIKYVLTVKVYEKIPDEVFQLMQEFLNEQEKATRQREEERKVESENKKRLQQQEIQEFISAVRDKKNK